MVQAVGALTLALAAVSFAGSAAGVRLSIHLARRIGILDVPNERSSHAVPTPRMGGVPMAAAAVLAAGCWVWLSGGAGAAPGLREALLFALAMSALGFWDDLSGLSPFFRLAIQFAGAGLFLWAGGRAVIAAGAPVLFSFVWLPAGILWTVWMLNLYNFMDGIDGLAGGEAVIVSSFFFLVFMMLGEPAWAAANLLVAASAAGFLIYNRPPAQVFMGDAGSAFLGAFYGFQSVAASLSTSVPFPVLVLPLANFILDTATTLVRRVVCREKWYTAHRSHFYQRMTRLGMSHAKVTGLELASAIFSCAAAGIYLSTGAAGRIVIVLLVLSVFVAAGLWVSKKERGKEVSGNRSPGMSPEIGRMEAVPREDSDKTAARLVSGQRDKLSRK